MFFITILATAYAITATLRQSQLKSQLALKEQYEEDINNVNEIAQKLAYTGGKLDINSEEVQELIKQIKLSIYPIGSIYTSIESTSPADLFGGTWERIEDTFLLAAGSTYAAGTTGGEATHTLTNAEMPSHSHVQTYNDLPMVSGYNFFTSATAYGWHTAYDVCGDNYQQITFPTGGSQAHNNMPPYLTVYVWKRVA